MEKVTGTAFGSRLAVALTIAATMSSCTTPARPKTASHSPTATLGSSGLTRLVIDDDWDGYSPITPVRSHWVIEPRGAGFVLYGSRSQGRMPAPSDDREGPQKRDVTNVPAQTIPATAVDTLVRTMRAPSQPVIDLALFGAAVGHAGAAIDQRVQGLLALGPPRQAQRRIVEWGQSLRQGPALAEALTHGLASPHTDDYPHASVEASFADGSSLTFATDSQGVLMLPWHDATGQKTFSSDFSHALAALLPAESINRERLSGEPVQSEFDEALNAGLILSYNRFKAQILTPGAYTSVQSRFAVNDISAPVFLGAAPTTSPPLVVTVSLPAGPPNLILRAVLETKGPNLAAPRELDRMADDLRTAAAATELRQAMVAAPGDQFLIDRESGVAIFDESAKARFAAQMQELNELPELGSHPELLDGAVLVTQGNDPALLGPRSKSPIYWIALRDHRAVALTRLAIGGNNRDSSARLLAGSHSGTLISR